MGAKNGLVWDWKVKEQQQNVVKYEWENTLGGYYLPSFIV